MDSSRRLPFSLTAFLVAPWPVPLASCAVLSFTSDGRQSVAFFFIALAVSLAFSYLGTSTLVVCLHFVAQARPVTRLVSAVSGVLLAALGYLPFAFLSWGSSGPDSGPPVGAFPAYLLRCWNDPILGLFLAGGLVAALLYDFLARRQARKRAPVRP